MRLISWNVNGLRAVLKKDFMAVFEEFDADVFALQETKLQAGQVDLELPRYYQFWSYAERKGYSGTAVFCKERPLQVLHGLGDEYLDREGRIVAAEFESFWFVDVYTPNAQNELARIDHRMQWDDAFRDFCKGLEAGVLPAGAPVERPATDVFAPEDEQGEVVVPRAAGADGEEGAATDADRAGRAEEPAVEFGCGHVDAAVLPRTQAGETAQPKPVVMCGDFNVAHNEIDLKNPGPNRGNAGFSDEERGKFTDLLDAGFTDTFRMLHPDLEGAYSWWSYRFKARQNNAGWRIDYFLVSDTMVDQVESASIFSEVMGSDHCPVGVELAF